MPCTRLFHCARGATTSISTVELTPCCIAYRVVLPTTLSCYNFCHAASTAHPLLHEIIKSRRRRHIQVFPMKSTLEAHYLWPTITGWKPVSKTEMPCSWRGARGTPQRVYRGKSRCETKRRFTSSHVAFIPPHTRRSAYPARRPNTRGGILSNND